MYSVKSIIAGTIVLALAGVTSAHAEDVYVVHGIPVDNAPATEFVDIEVVELSACVPNVSFGAIQDPLDLPPGTYTVNVRVSDGSCGGAIAIPTVLNVKNGALVASQTVVVHLAENGSPTITTFDNFRTQVSSSNARLVLHHTARAPNVDVVVRDRDIGIPRTVRDIENGDQATRVVDEGSYAIIVRPSGTNLNLLRVPLDAVGDTAYLLYVVGSPSGDTLTALAIEVLD